MPDGEIELRDGRTVGYADYGAAADKAVLWCHGGPGSRVEPQPVAEDASKAGFRLIGIDRPGYGRSTPQPGRTIADWTRDALAVADHLRIERFAAVGVSTGGAYALALAAQAPERVLGAVACCALTDMRWGEGRAMMTGELNAGIWNARDRDTAMKLAVANLGADGSKMLTQQGPPLAPSDMALFADPAWLASMGNGMREIGRASCRERVSRCV